MHQKLEQGHGTLSFSHRKYEADEKAKIKVPIKIMKVRSK